MTALLEYLNLLQQIKYILYMEIFTMKEEVDYNACKPNSETCAP